MSSQSQEHILWWKQALSDLNAAEINLKQGVFYIASFLSQQAAEKALKALYIKKFKKLTKIHDLHLLALDLKLPEPLIEACNTLNAVYVETRYPDASGGIPAEEFTLQDAQTDLKLANEVVLWVKQKL